MKEPKFVYNQKVKIVKGFYRGNEAIIKYVIDIGFFLPSLVYDVKISDIATWVTIREADIEAIAALEQEGT